MSLEREVTSEGLEQFLNLGFQEPVPLISGVFERPLELGKEHRAETLARIRGVIGSVIGMTREAAVRRLCEAKLDGLCSLESAPYSTDLEELRRRREEVGDIHPEAADTDDLWRIMEYNDLPLDRLDLTNERAVDMNRMDILQYADTGRLFRYVSAHGTIVSIECVVAEAGEDDLPNVTAFESAAEFSRDPQTGKIIFTESGRRQITDSRTFDIDDHLIIFPEQIAPSISLLLPREQRPRLSAAGD